MIKLTGRVYTPRDSWGNAINWFEFDKRQIVGWQPRIPEIGGEIQMEMKSGKTARFVIKSVERCGDPPDMFFATVADIA